MSVTLGKTMIIRNKALSYSASASEKVQKEPEAFTPSAERVKIIPGDVATFPCFGEFPTEIRLQIWKEALPGPRVVQLEPRSLETQRFVTSGRVWSNWEITSDTLEAGLSPEEARLHTPITILNDQFIITSPEYINTSNFCGLVSEAKPPTILYVCHESYEVVSKYYTRAFASPCAFPTTWFDFKIDTLLLTSTLRSRLYYLQGSQLNFLEAIIPRLSWSEILKVNNIAISLKDSVDGVRYCYEWLTWVAFVFKNAETLTYELPRTEDDPGPWDNAEGEMELFDSAAFEKEFQRYTGNKKDFDRKLWLGTNWRFPDIQEKCIVDIPSDERLWMMS